MLNILLSNTGEYQENRPIQRRDMDSKTLDVSYYHWKTALPENFLRAVYIIHKCFSNVLLIGIRVRIQF